MYASWFVLYGLCAAIPPLVANENFVTTLLIFVDLWVEADFAGATPAAEAKAAASSIFCFEIWAWIP